MTMKFEIKNRFSGSVIFTAEIEANEDTPLGIKLGLAVRKAVTADANLAGAYLAGAYLAGANLAGAYLAGAYLAGANLAGANLADANLAGANLAGAYLAGANLAESTKLPGFQIPQEGELIVYKKTRAGVVKLRVPPEAKRTATPMGRKCRAEFVEVLEAPEGAWDRHSETVLYVAGKVVRPDAYNPSHLEECTNGIHFFLTREEAEAW